MEETAPPTEEETKYCPQPTPQRSGPEGENAEEGSANEVVAAGEDISPGEVEVSRGSAAREEAGTGNAATEVEGGEKGAAKPLREAEFDASPILAVPTERGLQNILIDISEDVAADLSVDPQKMTRLQEKELGEIVGPHVERGQKCIDRNTLRGILGEVEGIERSSPEGDVVTIAGRDFSQEEVAIGVIVFAVLLFVTILMGLF